MARTLRPLAPVYQLIEATGAVDADGHFSWPRTSPGRFSSVCTLT